MRPILPRVAVGWLALAGGFTWAHNLDPGVPAGHTPYDRYFGPLHQVMHNLGSQHPTLAEVNAWMREGNGFDYTYTNPYVPHSPEVTERTRAGDCKDKALWLASKMNDASVRFIVGDYTRGIRKGHAWLLWPDQGRWYLLDPAKESSAIDLTYSLGNDWIPKYSYTAHGQYRIRPAAPSILPAEPSFQLASSPILRRTPDLRPTVLPTLRPAQLVLASTTRRPQTPSFRPPTIPGRPPAQLVASVARKPQPSFRPPVVPGRPAQLVAAATLRKPLHPSFRPAVVSGRPGQLIASNVRRSPSPAGRPSHPPGPAYASFTAPHLFRFTPRPPAPIATRNPPPRLAKTSTYTRKVQLPVRARYQPVVARRPWWQPIHSVPVNRGKVSRLASL